MEIQRPHIGSCTLHAQHGPRLFETDVLHAFHDGIGDLGRPSGKRSPFTRGVLDELGLVEDAGWRNHSRQRSEEKRRAERSLIGVCYPNAWLFRCSIYFGERRQDLHVSATGPYRTFQRGAGSGAGDVITVHAGTYGNG